MFCYHFKQLFKTSLNGGLYAIWITADFKAARATSPGVARMPAMLA